MREKPDLRRLVGSWRPANAGVPSVEPSSTISSSQSLKLWAMTLSIASPR